LKQKKNLAPAAKKPEAVPAASAAVNEEYTKKDTIMVVLFSILLFLAMTVQTGRMTMILTGIALVAALPIGKDMMPRMRQRFCVPVIGLLAFALMQGLAAIYSPFDTYAVREYYKFLAAFALAVIVLVRFDKKHVRGLLWGVVTVCAIIALVCVDIAGSRELFDPFNTFINLFGGDFSGAIEASLGTRINGIYNDANITGAILGMTMLVAVHLTLTATKRKEQLGASVCLGISAVSFLLATSRGAIVCFAVACVCYILLINREKKLEILFLLLCFVLSLTITGFPAMKQISEKNMVPTVLALLCGPMVFLLYFYIGKKAADVLRGHEKAILAICGVGLVLGIVGVITVFSVTAPYEFKYEDESITRSVQMPVGKYQLHGIWKNESPAKIVIYSRTKDQELLSEQTYLYDGVFTEIEFEVVDEDATVYFRIYGNVGDVLNKVTISDGTELLIAYKWIPEGITKRLQDGLFRGHNFLQRVQYNKDALKLFKQSPLIGHGLGSTEGLYTSVQPYYYESKFVHNHILQFMTDTGLLGTISFLVVIFGIAWALLKAIHTDNGSLVAMLIACLVMMNGHSLMEINFSIRAFECVAYVLLALMVVGFSGPFSEDVPSIGGWSVAGFVLLYLAVFGTLLLSHRSVQTDAANLKTTDAYLYMSAMERFIERDVFEQEGYKISYVANAMVLSESIFQKNMEDYVKDLRKSGTYTASSALARYYYLPKSNLLELFACSREGIAQEASTNDAWNFQFDFYRQEVLPIVSKEQMDEFIDGVLGTKNYLETYNKNRLEKIQLTEENRLFIELVSSLKEEGVHNEVLKSMLLDIAWKN